MKILFIVGDYHNRRMKYAESMRCLGHDVRIRKIQRHKYRPCPLQDYEGVDLVWTQKFDYVARGVVSAKAREKMGQHSIPLVAYHTVGKGLTLKQTVDMTEPYSLVFENNYHAATQMNKLAGKKRFVYVPLGYHPDQYYPMGAKEQYDASFMGNSMKARSPENDLRVQMLQHLKQHIAVRVYGRNLCRRLGQKKVRPFSTHQEQRRVYAKTRVNLNFPWCNSTLSDFDGIVHPNNRFFEIPACRRIILTAWDEACAELLEPDKEAFYYRDREELVDKAKYILKHYDKLDDVREAGMWRCQNEHTFMHRIERVLNIVQRQLL